MNKKINMTLSALITTTIVLGAYANTNHNQISQHSKITQTEFEQLVAQGVEPDALSEALKAQAWAIKKGEISNPNILTIVEFDKASTDKRMKVIDLKKSKVLFSELVSQGKGSGSKTTPNIFSDIPDSKSSVHGALVTKNIYTGKHGQSLRLAGLEKFNENAMKRAIVVHPANYATENFAKAHGYLGRSWGCFAIDPSISKQIIQTIKGGTMIFAYAPQASQSPNYS